MSQLTPDTSRDYDSRSDFEGPSTSYERLQETYYAQVLLIAKEFNVLHAPL